MNDEWCAVLKMQLPLIGQATPLPPMLLSCSSDRGVRVRIISDNDQMLTRVSSKEPGHSASAPPEAALLLLSLPLMCLHCS